MAHAPLLTHWIRRRVIPVTHATSMHVIVGNLPVGGQSWGEHLSLRMQSSRQPKSITVGCTLAMNFCRHVA
jgi:hypothetical protein